jgi:hypothetical protein
MVALLLEHLHPPIGQPTEHRRGLGVGAADGKATLHKDSSQGRHADATNPNEVEGLIAIEHKVQERHRDSAENRAKRSGVLLLVFYELLRIVPLPAASPRVAGLGRP